MTDLMEMSRRGLEEAFFAEHNELLRQRLIEAERQASRKAALTAASGITDEAVLARIMALDIGPEALAALSLVPLLLVAWADGTLDAAERAAILKAAAEARLGSTGRAHELLQGWLQRPPPAALLDTWAAYVRALVARLDAGQRTELRTHLLGALRSVAEASGGFLGLGRRISDAEAAMLARLEAAFGA
jgi:tellurite resistance protein